jgi:hypothetical protein
MNKRQLRIDRIKAVRKEYLAARTAANLLLAKCDADPSYRKDEEWTQRDGIAISENLEEILSFGYRNEFL